MLDLATTDVSFRRIVDDLQHPVQQGLVEMPEHGNHLVLAGPGSGKTRVIVHRIAYLLRVRRVAAERIIALAFNRSAAVELRRRLIALVGDDARGVTVLTYHGMALRLTGTSLAAADRRGGAVDFGRLLQDAIDLLEGKSDAFSSDADERRDTLMQGYEYIFVDEYQDIDEQQYSLVSALAGRRLNDPEAKLSIMAVGDDDQNIYSFKGASVEFIRRFQADYEGTVTYLVENFRSTQNIIAAANHVIQRAADRMKVDHPIRIDSRRATDPPGGRWAVLDPEHHGKVRLVTAPADPNRQAQVVFSEIARIRRSDAEVSLGDIAILARTHRSLEPLRALCDVEGLRYEVLSRDGAGAQLPLMQSREGWKAADLLRARRSALVSVAAIRRWIGRQVKREPRNIYWQDIAAAVDEFADSAATPKLPAAEVLDALYEAASDARRSGHASALKLMTAHGAKGLEFRHVIVMDCADWRWSGEDERRLLYVAMTRAKETLTLMRAEGGRNPYFVDLGTVEAVADLLPSQRPEHRPDIDRRYLTLGQPMLTSALQDGMGPVMRCTSALPSCRRERRSSSALLYVAMTRAKETLTLMRAEGGRNPYFVDLGTVEAVADMLPSQRPEHRSDIDLRYLNLGPADVDIGFAGRHGPSDLLHERIAELSPGDVVIVSGRHVKTGDGQPVGRLASKTDLKTSSPVAGSVSGILVRTREQTPPAYLENVKVDRWETVLVELVLPGP